MAKKRVNRGANAGAMGRPRELDGAWAELAARFDTIAELADAMNVSVRTLNHWTRGDRNPARIVKASVNAFAKRHGCSEPFPADLSDPLTAIEQLRDKIRTRAIAQDPDVKQLLEHVATLTQREREK